MKTTNSHLSMSLFESSVKTVTLQKEPSFQEQLDNGK